MSNNAVPIKEFRLELSDLTYTGHDLVRPESILAQRDGTLWTSDGRGGVTRIDPDGQQHFLGGLGGEPNGLAMAEDGSIYVANIGTGTIQRLHPDGRAEEFLTEVDGVKVTTANFVFLDSRNRLWMSFSTRESHWWPAAAQPRPDGYIVLLDEKGPRIVADGIYFTNEVRLDAREEYLYVAETMMSHIIRYKVLPDGSLTNKEIFGPDSLGLGAFVDGFTFDADGNIWVTTVIRNGLGIITQDGDYHVVFEEANEALLASFGEKIASGTAQPTDMAATAGQTLQLITNVTFGGPDLRTVYIGSLAMSRLPTFRSPVPGLP
ncbi:MAG: SMP-30/gluconolactonase/LRE family protein, partial [Ktedonobacteraceae bacterium]